jgi:hypothetical protein
MSSFPKIVQPESEQFPSEVTNTNISAALEVCIPVTKADIEYDKSYADRTGWLKVEPDASATRPDGSAPERLGDTVLQLLTFLIYTRDGHKLLMDNPFNRDAVQGPDSGLHDTGLVKKDMMEVLHERFPTLDPHVIDVVIEAHFTAGEYAAAEQDTDEGKANATRLQNIYKQRLVAILGALHDDLMGRDFSKAW